jgi:ring-1,2-phenylacetyl-CoA epoxidase subunit PaaB
VYGNVLTIPGEVAREETTIPPASAAAPPAPTAGTVADGQWQLWEVFTQEEQGAPHEHAGSVRATTAEHAIQNARDVYGRRGKVISMWVVPAGAISATTPSDAGPLFEPGNDKAYRHPHYYKTPRGVRGL